MGKGKMINALKRDMLVLAILEIIIVFGYYLSSDYLKSVSGNVPIPIQNILFIVILILGYFSARKGKKYAGYIGIVAGILMTATILTYDIIGCLIGIFILIDSIKYLKIIKENN